MGMNHAKNVTIRIQQLNKNEVKIDKLQEPELCIAHYIGETELQRQYQCQSRTPLHGFGAYKTTRIVDE